MIGDTSRRLYFRVARSRARAALLAAAVACTSCGTPLLAPERTPFDRYKIVVEETRARIYLGVPAAGDTLSDAQRETVKAFARDYRNRGHGAVTIALPGEGVDPAAVSSVAFEVRGLLNAQGLPLELIDEKLYQPADAGDVAVAVYYTMYEAHAPECHQSGATLQKPSSQTRTISVARPKRTLAAAIANPRDLVTPRAEDPSDLARRRVALERYRSGETTATSRGADETVTLSDAAK